MPTAELVSHGRLTIPKRYRERFCEKFRIKPYNGELKLITFPEDPVEDLRDLTSEIRQSGSSIEELKQEVREEISNRVGRSE